MPINKVKAYKDETLLSWLRRTASANTLNVESLNNLIIKKQNPRHVHPLLPNDHCLDIAKVFNAMGIKNWYEFFLEHSYYPITALFLSPIRQTLLLDKEFCGGSPIVRPRVGNTEYICPECEKEASYIHRSHNIPGVKVCYKHKCSLLDNGVPLVEDVTEADVRYAKFCHDLLCKRHDTDSKELFLENSVNIEQGINSLIAYPAQLTNLQRTDIPLKLNKEEYEILCQSNNLCDVIHKPCGTRFLMNSFGLNNGFTCPRCRASEEELYKQRVSERKGYELVAYTSNRLTILHKPCGETFTTSIARFYEGRECKCAHAWTLPRIRKEISKYSDFEFVSSKARSHSIKLKHKECGKVFTTQIETFVESHACPICSPKTTTEADAIKTVNMLGFVYKGGFKTNKKRLTLECPKGHTFHREFCYLVRENHDCPICKRQSLKFVSLTTTYVPHKERIQKIVERERSSNDYETKK